MAYVRENPPPPGGFNPTNSGTATGLLAREKL